MKTTLLIMAAGIGSRFGGGIKQLEPVDSDGHIIMDYSIHDAIEAGFNRIVFIIRKDIEADFKRIIGDRIGAVCALCNVDIQYAFQSTDAVPTGFSVPEGRNKPWGTGHAVLSAKKLIDEPFAVINADDYYGKDAFIKLHDFLISDEENSNLCMAGFALKNTLSDHGGVTRGICRVDQNGYLTEIVETHGIVKTAKGAVAQNRELDPNALVSMNMWGLTPGFMDALENGFKDFLETDVKDDPMKAEYLLPVFIGQQLQNGSISVKVLKTSNKWFGVTYQEDKYLVVQKFTELINKGIYCANLYSDLHSK